MHPIVKVLYLTGDNIAKLQECQASGKMTSLEPADFGLHHSCRIIAVFHKMTALATFVNGNQVL